MFETSKLLFVVHRPNDQAGRYSHSIFFPLSIPFFGESPTFGSVAITGLFRMRRPSHDTVIVPKRTYGRRMSEEFDLLAGERSPQSHGWIVTPSTTADWKNKNTPTNEKSVTVHQIRDDREKNGENSMEGANVENQASPKQREAPAASEGGSFQISISICPCRCSRDGSRDNDTTTINDSSRGVVSRWAPDIFDAKPSYNTPSNIYIVVRAIAFYLICPSKPINERHFPDQRCESITEITFPNPFHRAFSFTSF